MAERSLHKGTALFCGANNIVQHFTLHRNDTLLHTLTPSPTTNTSDTGSHRTKIKRSDTIRLSARPLTGPLWLGDHNTTRNQTDHARTNRSPSRMQLVRSSRMLFLQNRLPQFRGCADYMTEYIRTSRSCPFLGVRSWDCFHVTDSLARVSLPAATAACELPAKQVPDYAAETSGGLSTRGLVLGASGDSDSWCCGVLVSSVIGKGSFMAS